MPSDLFKDEDIRASKTDNLFSPSPQSTACCRTRTGLFVSARLDRTYAVPLLPTLTYDLLRVCAPAGGAQARDLSPGRFRGMGRYGMATLKARADRGRDRADMPSRTVSERRQPSD